MPNKVHCAHILVKTEKEANAVLERLKKGEKFANIAKEVSLCPSGKHGGDLGTFSRGKMVKEFESRLRPSERTDFADCKNEVWVPHNKEA